MNNRTFLLFSSLNEFKNVSYYGNKDLGLIIEERFIVDQFIEKYKNELIQYYILSDGQNCLCSYDNLPHPNVRIEKGAIIRHNVTLSSKCVILMNSVINNNAFIGQETMIDMGVIIGSGAIIGSRCHIGANAVIAGVMEPISLKPVVIEDDCFIGANAVILEGVKVGHGSIVGALTLVNKDVPPNSVCYGIPFKIVKSETAQKKCEINKKLR